MTTKKMAIAFTPVLGGTVSVLAVLVGLLILYEGITIGSGLASDAHYHFGTDVFEAKGGWAYRSRHAYLISSLIEGTPLFLGGATGLFAVVRRRALLAYIGAALVTVGIGSNVLRMWCTESWFIETQRCNWTTK